METSRGCLCAAHSLDSVSELTKESCTYVHQLDTIGTRIDVSIHRQAESLLEICRTSPYTIIESYLSLKVVVKKVKNTLKKPKKNYELQHLY